MLTFNITLFDCILCCGKQIKQSSEKINTKTIKKNKTKQQMYLTTLGIKKIHIKTRQIKFAGEPIQRTLITACHGGNVAK